MFASKNPQKSVPATTAHINELLDEALEETFPASDPIAINVELESPGHGITRFQAHARRRIGGRGRR
jgi:hypothetical protein